MLKSLGLQQVKLTGTYWQGRQQLFCTEVLERQWRILNGEEEMEGIGKSHCIDNFRAAAGETDAKFTSYWFSDHELYKWMEAASYAQYLNPEERIEEHLEYATNLLERAQWEDGYLNTYYTLYEPGKRFTNFTTGHEMLNAGNLAEAGIARFLTSGKRRLLDIAIRNVNGLRDMVYTRGRYVYDGHEEIEIALIKLYLLTGEKGYLDFAMRLIDTRGVGRCPFLDEGSVRLDIGMEYYQAHKPVRDQHEAEGHAVRAVYLYTAMAELGALIQDEALLTAVNALWEDIVQKKLYITGGIGSEHYGERFTGPYDLPNAGAYSETCASIGLMMLARSRLRLEPDARIADVMEKALYNGVMSGISRDGITYFYVNPLAVRPDVIRKRHDIAAAQPNRQKWMVCPCCPPNLLRLVLSLGEYLYTYDDAHIYLNLWLSNEAEFDRGNGLEKLSVEGDEPVEGRFRITAKSNINGSLHIKIPYWSETAELHKNGCPQEPYAVENGYIRLENIQQGDVWDVVFSLRPRFVYSHPRLEEDCGRIAVERGYLVYCAEEADNGPALSALAVDDRQEPEEVMEDILGGIPVVRLAGVRIQEGEGLYTFTKPSKTSCELRLIPYALWNNRGEGEMDVWLKTTSV